MEVVAKIGKAAEEMNHHPTIVIGPASDYVPTSKVLPPPDPGTSYLIELSVHTHTPLPQLRSKHPGLTVRPGLTTKDLQLAGVIENAYRSLADQQT